MSRTHSGVSDEVLIVHEQVFDGAGIMGSVWRDGRADPRPVPARQASKARGGLVPDRRAGTRLDDR